MKYTKLMQINVHAAFNTIAPLLPWLFSALPTQTKIAIGAALSGLGGIISLLTKALDA